jgi:hypothetical protein
VPNGIRLPRGLRSLLSSRNLEVNQLKKGRFFNVCMSSVAACAKIRLGSISKDKGPPNRLKRLFRGFIDYSSGLAISNWIAFTSELITYSPASVEQ